MSAASAFGARCFAVARPLVFVAPFQRRAQAVGVVGLDGGLLVVTPTPAIVAGGGVVERAVCVAPEPQPARARPPATMGKRKSDRFMPIIYTSQTSALSRQGSSGKLAQASVLTLCSACARLVR